MLKSATYNLELTNQQIYDIAWKLKCYLLDIIKSHYNKLQQNADGESVFFDHESSTLFLIKNFYELSGYGSFYTDMIREFKKLFADKRMERQTANNGTNL